MTEVSDIKDLNVLINNLNETNTELLNESLQKLILICQSSEKRSLSFHFESLFDKFPTLLLDENLSIVVQTSQFLVEIVTQFPKESGRYFENVLQSLIINLADSKPVVRKMAFNSLSGFIQMTKNYDLVFSKLTDHGILHANPQTRQKCIMVINNFTLADSSCMTSSSSFQKMIEKVIEKANESIDTVRSAAYQVINHLSSHYKGAFSTLVKKLSFSDQEKVRIILESPEANLPLGETMDYNATLTKSPLRVGDSGLEQERTATPQRTGENFDSPNRAQKNFKMTTKKTSFAPLQTGKHMLRYGLFEHKVIGDFTSQDWRVRLAATEEVLKTFEGLENTESVVPYMKEFLELIFPLLNDVNFKICINCLNILGIVVKLTSKHDLITLVDKIVSKLLSKLGDSKVAVRQIAFQILAVSMKKIDVTEFLYLIFEQLKENNWHMREECLLLIQMTFTSSSEEFPSDFYEETVENIIEILDDQKPKVRNTARETIVNVLRHSPNSLKLLSKIQPLLEKELYEYMHFRIQNPENFPRNNYTPYTDDSGLEPRDSLTMTGKSEMGTGEYDRTNSNLHFRSMTTSPRDPSMMTSGNTQSRNNMDSVYSASPYRKHGHENNSSPFQGNTTSYSTSSSNNQYHHHENNRYGNRNAQIGTPYEKKHPESENSPNLSSYGTPYTKASLNTPDSHQRLGNSSYTNQSGYYPKVHTPYQNQKGVYEISTASSSRSGYSRNTNTIYSFETSSVSGSSVLEKGKLSRAQAQQPVSYTNMLDSRIQSAQNGTDLSSTLYGKDKRTYSATEELGKVGSSGFQNRLSKKVAIPHNDTYLEYSITKKLDDFTSNNFEGHEAYGQTVDPKIKQDVFSSIDSLQQQDSQYDPRFKPGASANPYRNTRPELAQKLKKLQAQQHYVIMETDESKKTLRKDSGDNLVDKKRPPLPGNKRGYSQNPKQELEKTVERDGSGSEDEDTSFSLKTNMSNKTIKRKIAPKNNNETLTVPEYKKLDYVSKEQLEPIEGNMESLLRSTNSDLKSDDWQKQFEASNNLRRFLQFHTSFLAGSPNFNLHSTTQDVLKMVESLRSNLSKNGLITLTEMCGALKKQLDSEAEMIIAKLIKKCSDANSFISEEVKKAFVAVCQNCSDTKMIPLLASILQQKAISPKINIAVGIESIIVKHESRVNQLRDFDKIVVLLGNYMLDSALEIRNASKQGMSALLSFLFSKSEIDRILQRSFTEGNVNKLNNIINKELSSGTSTLLITNYQTSKNRSSSFKPKAPASKGSLEDEEEKVESKPLLRTKDYKETQESKESPISLNDKTRKPMKIGGKEPLEFENLPNIFTQAESNDWKTRFDAANALAEIGRKSGDNLHRSKLQLKYFDYFTKLIQDSNIKVSNVAIGAFVDLIPVLKPSIETNVVNVSTASLNVLGSVNPGIKSAADTLFETLSNCIDPCLLVPAWANALAFTNVKAKTSILSKLNELCPSLYNKKPMIITKNVIPVLSKCVEETKAEVRNSTQQVFQTLSSVMGRELLDYVPANKIQIISDIVYGK